MSNIHTFDKFLTESKLKEYGPTLTTEQQLDIFSKEVTKFIHSIEDAENPSNEQKKQILIVIKSWKAFSADFEKLIDIA
jgi:hypothetical protein